jgi:hypothetical protein
VQALILRSLIFIFEFSLNLQTIILGFQDKPALHPSPEALIWRSLRIRVAGRHSCALKIELIQYSGTPEFHPKRPSSCGDMRGAVNFNPELRNDRGNPNSGMRKKTRKRFPTPLGKLSDRRACRTLWTPIPPRLTKIHTFRMARTPRTPGFPVHRPDMQQSLIYLKNHWTKFHEIYIIRKLRTRRVE